MKIRKYFKISAILLTIALCVSSCAKTPVGDEGGDSDGNNNSENVDNGDDEDKDDDDDIVTPSTELVVPLNLTGEILNPGAPMTKASGSDLYYVQAYTVGDNGYDLTPYAHGLFDNVEGLEITLEKEKQYKFFATMVVDAKNRITLWDEIYGLPFNVSLSNKFRMGELFDSYGICYGYANIIPDKFYYMPDLDRYYGESDIYTASPDNTAAVDINMIRTVFGLKVEAGNLTEGQLLVKMNDSPTMTITYPETETSGIFSFGPLAEVYRVDAGYTSQYSELITVSMVEVTSEGLEISVGGGNYQFYRNMITTLKVTITGESEKCGITVTVENAEMQPDGQEDIEFVGGGTVVPLPGN